MYRYNKKVRRFLGPPVHSKGRTHKADQSKLSARFVKNIADNSKLEFVSFHCHSHGKLEQIDGKYIMSEVILEPRLVITHEAYREKAEKVLQKSEAACLISNSIKSKVSMKASIITKENL